MNASDWSIYLHHNESDHSLPMSCCPKQNGAIGNASCTMDMKNFYYDHGCLSKFVGFIGGHAVQLGGVGLGIAFVQVNLLSHWKIIRKVTISEIRDLTFWNLKFPVMILRITDRNFGLEIISNKISVKNSTLFTIPIRLIFLFLFDFTSGSQKFEKRVVFLFRPLECGSRHTWQERSRRLTKRFKRFRFFFRLSGAAIVEKKKAEKVSTAGLTQLWSTRKKKAAVFLRFI